ADLRQEVEARKAREQALAQSEQRLQLATRAARLGIWDWDVERDEIVWDDTMYELYGVERGSFRGAYDAWVRCLAPEDFQRATAAVDAALRGERELAIEFRVPKRDGTVSVLRGIAQTIRDETGKPRRMVGVNWDVTERQRAESELRKHRDHLEELVHERTLALEQAKEQADAANRAKSAFLANMSHEIRTPMNAILGFGQLMERQSDLSARDRDRLARIMASGRHLLELINAVLEMSKIEAGRTTLLLEPFDLVALLEDVRLMFGELIGEKGVSVVFELADDLPRGVIGDAAKVRQVVINLLSNAAKFTELGRIGLRASAQLQADGRALLEIRVEDTGAGIEPASLERIFGAFDQSASGARGGGTGLGLTISRSFARLMEGDLRVHSTPGAGSVFTFTFVAKLSQASVPLRSDLRPVRVHVPAGRAQPKVLVVDDEPVNAELMVDLLSHIGFEVRAASSGQEALRLDASFEPELVLMDLQMPGMDGFAATRALRARGSNAAIIAFTASALAESEPDALAAGADAFLRKPYREAELLTCIAQVLGLPCTAEEPSKPAPKPEETPALATLVSSLPAELVAQLREATIQARAERIERLTERAAEHSEAAAGQIRALARSFQYEKLLAAFETRH
ncbi:MAG TPA: ATP-binding protein, partial [Polyangiales bacterium]|nr:ATP-binding protein [Polyangiales bacterium]